ncbi:probable L-type lectin-domain containing receptor kinase S.5 [Tanacetum coccineum]
MEDFKRVAWKIDPRGASIFNQFIYSLDLLDLPVGGKREFLDHTPILLKNFAPDFGPTPFKLYNSWLEHFEFPDLAKHRGHFLLLGLLRILDKKQNCIGLPKVMKIPNFFMALLIVDVTVLQSMALIFMEIGLRIPQQSKITSFTLSRTDSRKVVASVVGDVQMTYIKGRQIINGPLMVEEIIAWAKKAKKRLMILKVDFEKAFDLKPNATHPRSPEAYGSAALVTLSVPQTSTGPMDLVTPPGLNFQWAWRRDVRTSPEIEEFNNLPTRWNRALPSKININTWRVSNRRLPTRINLDCRSVELDSVRCPMCDEDLETEDHIFVSCNIASETWKLILNWWCITNISVNSLHDAICLADQTHFATKKKRLFDVVVQTTLSCLWRFRNHIIFSNKRPSKDLMLNDIKLLSFNWITSRSTDIAKFETFTQNYDNFNLPMIEAELKAENSASVNNDALQITPDITGVNLFNLQHRSGRIMLRKKFELWNGDDSLVASFKTHFLVNMYPAPTSDNTSPGEGLAFLIAPTIDIPGESYGPYLGLTNPNTEGDINNGILAVELDTVKQSFDTDNNHIGLNIHSIRSVYNGTEKIIRVYIADQPEKSSPTPPVPETPIIEYNLDLTKIVNKESYFGFAASTGTLVELNCVLQWNITIRHITGSNSNLNSPLLLSVGITFVVGLLVLGAYLGYYLYKKRLVERSNSYILDQLRTLPGMPKEFRFGELKKATNNFDEKRKLGQGGFGVVYHGLLSEDNGEVAVKCLFISDPVMHPRAYLPYSISGSSDKPHRQELPEVP